MCLSVRIQHSTHTFFNSTFTSCLVYFSKFFVILWSTIVQFSNTKSLFMTATIVGGAYNKNRYGCVVRTAYKFSYSIVSVCRCIWNSQNFSSILRKPFLLIFACVVYLYSAMLLFGGWLMWVHCSQIQMKYFSLFFHFIEDNCKIYLHSVWSNHIRVHKIVFNKFNE